MVSYGLEGSENKSLFRDKAGILSTKLEHRRHFAKVGGSRDGASQHHQK